MVAEVCEYTPEADARRWGSTGSCDGCRGAFWISALALGVRAGIGVTLQKHPASLSGPICRLTRPWLVAGFTQGYGGA
jgi:hypothetical protein